MFKKILDYLYISKLWIKRLYTYPQKTISTNSQLDYNDYWKVKRNGNLGALGIWQSKRVSLSVNAIQKLNCKSVNDIGSGAGEVLNAIKSKVDLQKAICYDSSTDALKVASSFGLETKEMDVSKNDDLNKIGSADVSLLFEILEHLPLPEVLLKEVYSKSNKAVLFSIPNSGFFIYRLRLFIFGKFPMQWAKHPGEHLRFWTKKDLVWWLEAQGYRNYKIYGYMGILLLKNIFPGVFSAGFFVELKK